MTTMALRGDVTEVDELHCEMVRCPRQPGRLMISSQACAGRYRLAQRRDLKLPKDEFEVALISGLALCGGCPDGRYFWQRLGGVPAGESRSHGGGASSQGVADERTAAGDAPRIRSVAVGVIGTHQLRSVSTRSKRRR